MSGDGCSRRCYTDDGGKKRSRVEVIAESVILLSRDEQKNGTSEKGSKEALGVSDDDAPF